jgi:hypothetical protein
MNDRESNEDVVLTTEEIANAGSRTEDVANMGQYPVPDVETAQAQEAARAERAVQVEQSARAAQSARSEQAPAREDFGSRPQPHAQLLEDQELQAIRGQWRDIQAEFVDEPRKAVQQADALVAELMQRMAQMFASEREDLESRWAGGDDVSTEDLRRGLRRYRSFFERLLAA